MPPGRGLRVVARLPRFVGRGIDPAAGVCLMIPFSGNVAAPAPCVIRFGFFTRQIPFLYLRQYGFCPDSWPRFRGRHCGTNALRWFCLRQKTEKAAANSEAPGHGQRGLRAPLETPGLQGGRPRRFTFLTRQRPLCYNPLFFSCRKGSSGLPF